MIKIDDNGNVLWQKALGPSTEINCLSQEMADGTVILGGGWFGDFYSVYPMLAKIDTDGNVIWQKVVKTIGFTDTWDAIVALDDFGFLAGSTGMIARFDKDGNPKWIKLREIPPAVGNSFSVFDLVEATSGGYIVATVHRPAGINTYQAEIIRLTENGEVLWAKRQTNYNDPYAELGVLPFQIMPKGNGEYLIACWYGQWNAVNLFFSFKEDGTMDQSATSYRSPYFEVMDHSFANKYATFAEDGTIAFVSSHQIGSGASGGGKALDMTLVKTGIGNNIEGSCSEMGSLPLIWEDIAVNPQDVSYEITDLENNCVDTAPYGFVNESYAKGMNTYCPVIYSVTKLQNPFRLKIVGDNLVSDYSMPSVVTINDIPVPMTTEKDVFTLIAKKGGALKKMLPKGVPVCIKVRDVGETNFESDCFTFTR